MSRFKCPECGIGEMTPEVISNHTTKLGGIQVEVPNAHVSRCTNCGELSVGAAELKRWAQIQQQQLRGAGQLPSPAEVRATREALGLSVADFAKLLGVTRQTVYAWEREDLSALQLGPTSLLLGTLKEELDGHLDSVLAYLLQQSAKRGEAIRQSESLNLSVPHARRFSSSRPKSAIFWSMQPRIAG